MDDLSCGQCWDEAHRALDAERAAHAETRKALADEKTAHAAALAERARVERAREVRRRMATGAAWDALRAQVELVDALADAPAQAPAAVDASAVSHAVQALGDAVARPSVPLVIEPDVVPPRPATIDDLAALRRDAVRDALLAVAEAIDTADRSRPDGTWITYQEALRARAGQ